MLSYDQGKMEAERRGEANTWEIYDLELDLTETKDLAPHFSENVDEMSALWQPWALRMSFLPWRKP